MAVDVKDLAGKKVGTVDLPDQWFTGDVRVHVMHEVVTAQLAAARQGNASTKTRGEVAGGGAKPWRQKGTGRARHGSSRSPIWVGGGVAHGPRPRKYTKRVNKKVKRVALQSALTDRANLDAVVVVRDLAFEAPRTREAVAALTALELADTKILVVLADRDEATEKSLRNLPLVHTLIVDQLNTHDVLNADTVVFDEAALALIGTGRRAGSPAEEDAA
jgi:large subunit ribosomal protein L4